MARKDVRRKVDKKTLHPVQVTWLDHAMHSTGWMKRKGADECAAVVCQSAGFLVSQDKDVIRLAVNTDKDFDQVGDTMVIIKKCIQKIKYLK